MVDLNAVDDLDNLETDGPGGVVWSAPTGGDLNVNLVRLGPGQGIDEHRNDEVDVVVHVQRGSCDLIVDGDRSRLGSHHLVIIPCGARRTIRALDDGVTYLSIHRHRAALSIGSKRT